MRSVVLAVIVMVGLLLAGLAGSGSPRVGAQESTPVLACPEGATIAEASPAGEQEAVVIPFVQPGAELEEEDVEQLYAAVVFLEPNSCVEPRYRDAAIVLYVQQGPVFYTAQVADMADVQVMRGNNDGIDNDENVVAFNEEIELQTGDSITQDRRVRFTFRTGDNSAVVSAAVYGIPPWDDDSCTGSCRGRP